MTKVKWILWGVTTAIAVLALVSAFGAHDKVNEVREDLNELVEEHNSVVKSVDGLSERLVEVDSDVGGLTSELRSVKLDVEFVERRVETMDSATAAPVLLVFSERDFVASGSTISEAPRATLGETIVVTGVGFEGFTDVEVYIGGSGVIDTFELHRGGTFKGRVDVPTDIEVPETAGMYSLKVVRAENEESVAVYPIWIGERE